MEIKVKKAFEYDGFLYTNAEDIINREFISAILPEVQSRLGHLSASVSLDVREFIAANCIQHAELYHQIREQVLEAIEEGRRKRP